MTTAKRVTARNASGATEQLTDFLTHLHISTRVKTIVITKTTDIKNAPTKKRQNAENLKRNQNTMPYRVWISRFIKLVSVAGNIEHNAI